MHQERRRFPIIPMLFMTIESEDDRAFIENLYETQYARLRKKAAAITRNNQVAGDLVHDVFVYIADHIEKYRALDCCTLRHLVDISIRRRCYDYMKAQAVRQKRSAGSIDNEAWSFALSDANTSVEEDAIRNLEIEQVSDAIRQLPDNYRFVLEAKYLLNMNDEEISRAMGIRKGSVRQYLTRARKMVYAFCRGSSNEQQT